MKALGIRQPAAWSIVHGHKKEEYRSWQTHYRGPFFVHANKAINKKEVEDERARLAKKGIELPDDLPTGGIVGVVTLKECVPDRGTGLIDPILDSLLDRLLSDQDQEEMFAFILEDPQPLPFKEFRGRQKFFNVPDDLYGPENEF